MDCKSQIKRCYLFTNPGKYEKLNRQIRIKKTRRKTIYAKKTIEIAIKLWQKTRIIRDSLNIGRCRFYPSCSDYFLEAVNIHGIFNGSLLGMKRICRCHPLCEGGIDHVPDHGSRTADHGNQGLSLGSKIRTPNPAVRNPSKLEVSHGL